MKNQIVVCFQKISTDEYSFNIDCKPYDHTYTSSKEIGFKRAKEIILHNSKILSRNLKVQFVDKDTKNTEFYIASPNNDNLIKDEQGQLNYEKLKNKDSHIKAILKNKYAFMSFWVFSIFILIVSVVIIFIPKNNNKSANLPTNTTSQSASNLSSQEPTPIKSSASSSPRPIVSLTPTPKPKKHIIKPQPINPGKKNNTKPPKKPIIITGD